MHIASLYSENTRVITK